MGQGERKSRAPAIVRPACACQAQVRVVLPGGLRSLILRGLVARAWPEVCVCHAVYVRDSDDTLSSH